MERWHFYSTGTYIGTATTTADQIRDMYPGATLYVIGRAVELRGSVLKMQPVIGPDPRD